MSPIDWRSRTLKALRNLPECITAQPDSLRISFFRAMNRAEFSLREICSHLHASRYLIVDRSDTPGTRSYPIGMILIYVHDCLFLIMQFITNQINTNNYHIGMLSNPSCIVLYQYQRRQLANRLNFLLIRTSTKNHQNSCNIVVDSLEIQF